MILEHMGRFRDRHGFWKVYFECERCKAVNHQRVAKNYRTDICGKCRKSEFTSKQMRGNTYRKIQFVPEREELAEILARGQGAMVVATKKYGVTSHVIRRWATEYNIEFDISKAAIPKDFMEWYLTHTPTKRQIADRYGVEMTMIRRWVKDLDLDFKGVTTFIPLPPIEELVELNKTFNSQELADLFGVCLSKIYKTFRQADVTLKKFKTGISQEEKDLFKFVNSILPGWVSNVRGLLENKRLEFDMFHGDLRLAIEYDGAYYHSFMGEHNHYVKHEMSEDARIDLVRIHCGRAVAKLWRI